MNKKEVEVQYLTPSEHDKKFGLSVSTVGYEPIAPHSPYPLAIHPVGYYFNINIGRMLNEYHLVYITSGEGVFSVSPYQKISVAEGALLVISPGQWHTYYPLHQSGWCEYHLGFQGSMVDRFVENSFLSNADSLLQVGLNYELVSLFERAIEIAKQGGEFTQQYLSGIVVHMLGVIASSMEDNTGTKDPLQKIESAIVYMNEHIDQSINLPELAAKLDISYTCFRRLFKSKTGYTPARYFVRLKIRKAKQMLAETEHPVKRISYKLGYRTPDHFHSQFKKVSGQTASEYRTFACGGEK